MIHNDLFSKPVSKAYIGIDPGSSGVISLLTDTGEWEAIKLGQDMTIINRLFREMIDKVGGPQNIECVIEKVQAMPTTGPDKSYENLSTIEALRAFKTTVKTGVSHNNKNFYTHLSVAIGLLTSRLINVRGAKSTWTFAENYGALKMMLNCNNIRYIETRPQEWMKFFGLVKPKGATVSVWKNMLRGQLLRLYPHLEIKHVPLWKADGMLIATYAQAYYSGKYSPSKNRQG